MSTINPRVFSSKYKHKFIKIQIKISISNKYLYFHKSVKSFTMHVRSFTMNSSVIMRVRKYVTESSVVASLFSLSSQRIQFDVICTLCVHIKYIS